MFGSELFWLSGKALSQQIRGKQTKPGSIHEAWPDLSLQIFLWFTPAYMNRPLSQVLTLFPHPTPPYLPLADRPSMHKASTELSLQN